ncbi:MAG: enoyl-CoA hydratase [Ilumatobacter sp.]|nr:MAG: enoyl-CoA hydratase [Ilumatobacter sp.]
MTGPVSSSPSPSSSPGDPYAGFDRLAFERHEHGVLRITLDNPGKLNATDAAMHEQLSRIFAVIDRDESVRAVVVTGAGTAFSAGGDLDWIAEQVGNHAQTMRVMREAGDIVRTMIECDTPIVSAINGVAVGAGLAVALMADVSIIDQDTRLSDGHIRLGVAAGDHAVAIWPLLCGMAKAKYYLLTADFLDGREAERIGLVSRAVPADEVLPTAHAVAEKLARGPRDATRLTKRALNHWLRQALPNFEASLAYEMLNFLGADAAEGLSALQERRSPDFTSDVTAER